MLYGFLSKVTEAANRYLSSINPPDGWSDRDANKFDILVRERFTTGFNKDQRQTKARKVFDGFLESLGNHRGVTGDGFGPGPVMPHEATNIVFETLGEMFWDIMAPGAIGKQKYMELVNLWIAGGQNGMMWGVFPPALMEGPVVGLMFHQFIDFLSYPEKWPDIKVGLIQKGEAVRYE